MPPFRFTVIVYGSFGTGRSALTIKFMSGCFSVNHGPNIEDPYTKKVDIDEKKVIYDFLDCARTDVCSNLRFLYTKKCQGILLVYDVTNRSTFDVIDGFREECCRIRESDHIPVVLCGNKIDLTEKRQVETSEGQALAQKYGWPFFETSAKTGENVDEAFLTVFRTYGAYNENNGESDKKKCIIC